MVFGINSASNAVRKCKIARGEAECYLLLDCIASAINPKYHSRLSYYKLILHHSTAWMCAQSNVLDTCTHGINISTYTGT